jgi:hypothetical protein
MKQFLLIVTSLIVTSLMLWGGHVLAAGPFDEICKNNPSASVCQEVVKNPQNPKGKNALYGPGSLLARATSLAAIAVGVVSVVYIIIGGIKFTTSGGDSNNVTSARNTVLYAVIGLVIAAMAQVIVVFIINKI